MCCGVPQKGKMPCPQCGHFIGTNSHSCKICNHVFKKRPARAQAAVKTNLEPHLEPYGAKCETCHKMTGRGNKACSNCGHLNSCARRNCEWCNYKFEKKNILPRAKSEAKKSNVVQSSGSIWNKEDEFDDLFENNDYDDDLPTTVNQYSDEELDIDFVDVMRESHGGDTLMDFCNIPIDNFFDNI